MHRVPRARFLQTAAAGMAPLFLPTAGVSAAEVGQFHSADQAAASGAIPAVFNVCDPPYNAAGDGQAFDDAAIAACFADGQAKCPRGAVYLFPAGKVFRVRRAVTPPPAAVIFGFGATIKRMDQSSSPFTGAIAGGSTRVITGVASTAGFQPGDQVTLFNGSHVDPGYYTIAPGGVGPNSITLAAAARRTMSGGTICSAFPTVILQHDQQKVYGLTVDGNQAKFSAFQYFSNLVEIESADYRAIGVEIVSCTIQDAPGEGIVFCASNSICSQNILTNVRGDGIHLACRYSTIEGNFLRNCDQHNSRHSPRGAICFSQLNVGLRVIGNVIESCHNGIAAAMSQLDGVGGTGSIIADNQIKGAKHRSLYFLGSQGAPSAYSMTWRGNKCYGHAPSVWTNLQKNNGYPAGARQFELYDNYFEGPVSITQMNDITIRGNTVNLSHDTRSACLFLESSQNVEIASNELFGGKIGITISNNYSLGQPEEHILVHHNRCMENYQWGIAVQTPVTGPSIRIADNILRGSSARVSASWTGIEIYGPSDLQLNENTIWSSAAGSTGIYVFGGGNRAGATGSIVTGNHVRGCGVCIVLGQGSYHHIVKGNQLAPHAEGSQIHDYSAGSIVLDNVRLS